MFLTTHTVTVWTDSRTKRRQGERGREKDRERERETETMGDARDVSTIKFPDLRTILNL